MKSDEPAALSLEYYVVGFFDLLGQQDHLRRITGLPNESDPTSMAKARDDLRNTYGAVTAMRHWFRDAFDTYARKPLPEAAALHRTYVSAVEGCKRNVSLDNIDKIARALRVKAADLLKE